MAEGSRRKAAVHPTDMNFRDKREYSSPTPESDAESGYSSQSFRSDRSKDFNMELRPDRPSDVERLSEESDSFVSELSNLFKSNRFMRNKGNSWNLPDDRTGRVDPQGSDCSSEYSDASFRSNKSKDADRDFNSHPPFTPESFRKMYEEFLQSQQEVARQNEVIRQRKDLIRRREDLIRQQEVIRQQEDLLSQQEDVLRQREDSLRQQAVQQENQEAQWKIRIHEKEVAQEKHKLRSLRDTDKETEALKRISAFKEKQMETEALLQRVREMEAQLQKSSFQALYQQQNHNASILDGPSTQPTEAFLTMGGSYIIAIDFGTEYSGYAFSITSRGDEIDPRWKVWGEEVGLETPETPNCILFDKQEKFMSFGYVAKEDYSSKKGQEARDMFFFDCFKMALYDNEINRDLMIKAANGKSMKALKVFTEALRFLKDDALETINSNVNGRKFIPCDFTWVLTVPAICDLSAKQFMREAAMQAGIVSEGNQDKLVIALEPEAASVWCKKLPSDGFITQNTSRNTLDQSPGTQYIVVNFGRTIDITVHEVLEGGALKVLHKASVNDLGGQNVYRKFKQFLREIFCDGVWDKYEENYPGEVQKRMYDFRLFKKGDKDIEISCPFNLGRLAQTKKDIEKFFEGVQGASWDEGSIRISKEKLRSFFDESLQWIVKSLDNILRRGYRIGYILLVGGYADSQILWRHITEEYIDECGVLCPFRPQEAILKGAVMIGRNPAVVTSRKSAFTYGLAVAQRFDASKHRADKKFTNQDGEWCDIFMKLVEINEDVGWNQTKSFSLSPTSSTQTARSFYFYRTQHKSPKYVDEEGVEKIGGFVLDSPNTERGLDREAKLNINFGFTEMKATATDIDSGSTKSIKLDFMRR
ncbi:heat shock 70 kDa protein 12A-like isoform X2 [Xiphophorus hellerii]|uniref:heat shock 70 kDa protein 12A-like isoform X2 n=1 Tax=Xiphophorus hellerii TaxID=8084 RepID=UPI0013B39926|nr:heat shock 70 kDa protein 12A-like isoform X2 [Xiphophorus hellerii]